MVLLSGIEKKDSNKTKFYGNFLSIKVTLDMLPTVSRDKTAIGDLIINNTTVIILAGSSFKLTM